MKKYDTTFIIDSRVNDNDRDEIIDKVEKDLKKRGGEIDEIVRWGMRKLAYELKGTRQGFYVILYYAADPSIISEFENQLKLNESIIRYLTIVSDEGKPDYIIEQTHTSSSSTPAGQSRYEESSSKEETVEESGPDKSDDEDTKEASDTVEEDTEQNSSEAVEEKDTSDEKAETENADVDEESKNKESE
jgi:small subunit ribosomal protein S6